MGLLSTNPVTSFRDPAGQVLIADGRVFRRIFATYTNDFEACLTSPAVKKHVEARQIISSRLLTPSERAEIAEIYDLSESFALGQGEVLIEHERVFFPSFPYEWPVEMLEAAGRLTLNIADDLLHDGLGIKDATPYNVLFRGTQPVFVDVLSIERRNPLDPIWLPYGQFARTFLLPSVLNRRFGIPLEFLLLTRRDGIEPEEAYRLCGPLARLQPPMFTLATLPTWLGRRSTNENLYRKREVTHTEQAEFILRRIFNGLQHQLDRVPGLENRRSRWSNYAGSRESYTAQQFEAKTEFVAQVLSKYRPLTVLDLGCNTGQFSLQAARAGARVVAIDSDPVVVGQLWQAARAGHYDILPLVMNLARPSPPVGWRNAECPSFLDRARGAFDMVFALALLHHLLISERVPLIEAVSLIAELTTDFAVIEYVGTTDPMFQSLLRGRQLPDEQISQGAFEAAARSHFEILQSEEIPGSCRRLYVLKKAANGPH